MLVLGVVPVRMAAVRFPGKPLVDLARRPIVQWVYESAVDSKALDEVVVATPDEEIAERVRAFGGIVTMTSPHHATGTDRVAEVASRRSDCDVVVNVQGDQPFVDGEMLRSLVAPYRAPNPPVMSTLAAPLDLDAGLSDPNTVKVLTDRNSDAIYFSRSPVPYFRTAGEAPVYHHIGVYAFAREFLLAYAGLPPTPLELCEGLEQLRALEHGYRIRVCHTSSPVIEVNTPADLEAARTLVEF